MADKTYREQLEDIEKRASRLEKQFNQLANDSGFKKKFRSLSQLRDQAAEHMGKLRDAKLLVTVFAGHVNTLETKPETDPAYEPAKDVLDMQIRLTNDDFSECEAFIKRYTSKQFQERVRDTRELDELQELSLRYRNRLNTIAAIKVPQSDRSNLGIRDKELKEAYERMRNLATQAKAQGEVAQARMRAAEADSFDEEESTLASKLEVYQEIISSIDTAYDAFTKAESAYNGVIKARQDDLRAALARAEDAVQAFGIKVFQSERLFNSDEQEAHSGQVVLFDEDVESYRASIPRANNRQELQGSKQNIDRFTRSVESADRALGKLITKKLDAKRKALEAKKAEYLKEIRAQGREAQFEGVFQELPDLKHLQVGDAMSILEVIEQSWAKAVQDSRQEELEKADDETVSMHTDTSSDVSVHEPSILEQFANAMTPPPQERDPLLDRITAYGIGENDANKLLLTVNSREAVEALLDKAKHGGITLDEGLNDYMPTLLGFMAEDADVLGLLCKLHENPDEDFKVYVDEHNLLPRFLMLFQDAHNLYDDQVETLKHGLLSKHSNAYQMILASFLYDGHPLMSTENMDASKYLATALATLRDQLPDAELKDYPENHLEELAQTMLAFSKTFHKQLVNYGLNTKMSSKLRQAQFDVFKALVRHPKPQEGIQAAEQIISERFELTTWQAICKGFLEFCGAKNTETYQYLKNKVESRERLDFQAIKKGLVGELPGEKHGAPKPGLNPFDDDKGG